MARGAKRVKRDARLPRRRRCAAARRRRTTQPKRASEGGFWSERAKVRAPPPLLLAAARERMTSPAPDGAALPPPASLGSLPTHLAVCVLAFLDLPSLLSASRVSRALHAAACDERLWADGALQRRAPLHARPAAAARCATASLTNALADALGAALVLPPPLLRPRLSLDCGSSFQACLSLGGLHAALELIGTNAAEDERVRPSTTHAPRVSVATSAPADRWLLGLMASPAAALAAVSAAAARAPCQRDDIGASLAEGASRARAAVLCARLERGGVRLQLAPRFVAAAALRAAAERADEDAQAADADADADARARFWAQQRDNADVADAARALAAAALPAEHALRTAITGALVRTDDDAAASANDDGIVMLAATACLADIELSLRLDAALHAPWSDAGAAAGAVRALARVVGGCAGAAAPRADGGGALALGAPQPPPLSAARAALLDAALAALRRMARDRAAAEAVQAQAQAAAAAIAAAPRRDDGDMRCD
jgi:hypothetical protein